MPTTYVADFDRHEKTCASAPGKRARIRTIKAGSVRLKIYTGTPKKRPIYTVYWRVAAEHLRRHNRFSQLLMVVVTFVNARRLVDPRAHKAIAQGIKAIVVLFARSDRLRTMFVEASPYGLFSMVRDAPIWAAYVEGRWERKRQADEHSGSSAPCRCAPMIITRCRLPAPPQPPR